MSSVVLLTEHQVQALITEAVTAALAQLETAPPPALLDRVGLARALQCSPSHVDALRRRGMPTVRLGDAPRFELAQCLSWLREHGAAAQTAATPTENPERISSARRHRRAAP